jgi:NADH-quinone oxidoreductase subunit E
MDLLRRTFPREVADAIAKYPPGRQASAVLNLLYLAQAAYGRLTPEAVGEVAEVLEMDPTQVRGLVGFYTLLLEEPHGGYVVQYCNDLPCALRGADDFLPVLCDRLGTAPGGTSADGLFTLQTVMCLAACDRAPMMQVNLEYVYDLTPESLEALVADLRARAAANPPRRPPFGFGPPSEMGASGAASGPVTATNGAGGTPGDGEG